MKSHFANQVFGSKSTPHMLKCYTFLVTLSLQENYQIYEIPYRGEDVQKKCKRLFLNCYFYISV